MAEDTKQVLNWIERSSLSTLEKRLRKYATEGEHEKLSALAYEIEALYNKAQRLDYMLGE